jgi:hypothetical protein
MKKIFAFAALSLLLLTSKTYAATENPRVPVSVSDQFTNAFSQATDVQWTTGANVLEATFHFRGTVLFAFYKESGDLMGVGTNISSDQLPKNLKAAIKKSYGSYWITELSSYWTPDTEGYVITLENSDRVVTFTSDGSSAWSIYKSSVKQ